MKILRGSISIISLIIFLFSLFPLPSYGKEVTDIKEIFNIQNIVAGVMFLSASQVLPERIL